MRNSSHCLYDLTNASRNSNLLDIRNSESMRSDDWSCNAIGAYVAGLLAFPIALMISRS
ncbi:hypothetical protein BDV38DRAFT_231685 [Aspergillus pseudotamarii]|uniref:Uncharacterized protein n=1 Tax=Aspergillus pseudotamarii TaxID=132259 RepID=A0A5N6TBS7_ASPPS|nr:uncharacterized protein BDV38DRAFT_231685 [Aspergillus pseudotamarii]KAE8143581.1 hypothetical protein BDV38DRAFT_231685 [Aspergillus pseudotamarii]